MAKGTTNKCKDCKYFRRSIDPSKRSGACSKRKYTGVWVGMNREACFQFEQREGKVEVRKW